MLSVRNHGLVQGGDAWDGGGKQLVMPYLRVPRALPVAVLAKYVAQRVAEPRVQLFCRDTALQESQTVRLLVSS